MEVARALPDALVPRLQQQWGDDLSRHVLESVALACCRARMLGESALRRVLGLATRVEVHAFLKAHEVPFYTLEDLEHGRKILDRLGL